MQLKYIVAAIASLAVSSAIANPVAEPAGNDVADTHLGARTDAVNHIKVAHDKYGAKLHAAYQKNYALNPNAPRPTEDDLKELAAQKNKKQSVNKRWSYSWNYQVCRERNWRPGCQIFFPFSTHAHIFNYDIIDYYTCFESFMDCSDDWDNCDCEYGYC